MANLKPRLCARQPTPNKVIYTVQNLKTNLLGLPAILSLNLIARIHQITDSKESAMKEFPNLFGGLGTMVEEYDIRLTDNDRPRALHTARNVSGQSTGRIRENTIPGSNFSSG